MKDELRFMELLGGIDMELISQAGQPWVKKASGRHLKIAGVILVILLSLSCIFHTEVKAGIQRAVSYIAQVFGLQESIVPYTKIINQTVMKNGISITIEDIALDDDELLITYKVEGDEEEKLLLNDQVIVDDEPIQSREGHYLGFDGDGESYRKVECYRFSGDYVHKNEMDIQIKLQPDEQPYWMDSFEAEDEFVYHFSASKEDLQRDTITLNLNQIVELPNHESVCLTEFTLNAIDSTITGTCGKLQGNWEYYFKGQDSLGNEVMYRSDGYTNPTWKFVEDRTEGYISPKAEYVELQLYIHKCQPVDVVQVENGDVIEETFGCDDPYNMHPVGEKFVVQIQKNKK